MITLFIIIFCFFIFLYNLYYISRDDFVILRKDISIDKILTLAFLTGFVSLFFSRLLFAIYHPESQIIDPLGFFAITYFPGLSLSGGILGATLFVYFYAKLNKLPIGKMLDLIMFSFIAVLPFSFLMFFIFNFGKTDIVFNSLFLSTFVISLIFIKILYRFCEKGEIRDGSFSLIFLSVFSLIFFLVKLFSDINAFTFFDLENLVLFLLIFSSLILLVNQEIIDKFLGK